MSGLISNAAAIAAKYDKRAKALKAKLRARLIKLGSEIENEQVDLLSGGEIAGDYPVPVRTGSLKRNVLPPKVRGLTLKVGNTSSYAIDIHEGLGSSEKYGDRPFVFDAIEKTDAAGAISRALFEAMAV